MHQSLVQCFLHRLMSSVFSLSSQQTPLHTAAKVGNEYTMRELVELGANMNIKDNDGVSETVLNPQSLHFIFVCIPRSSVTPRSHNLSNSSKHGPHAWYCS